MKKIAIIGASYLQRPLVEKAREMGLYTLCFAWPQGAICKEIADEYHPISVTEKEQILAVCENAGIDGICTIASDISAPTVAYVAEHLGLVGNPYEAAVRANDKYMMRKAFSEGGVRCPCFQEIETVGQLDREKLFFPVIVKPVDRSGSLGVSIVERDADLERAVEQALELSFKHEAIVEDYVEGREISVEFISYKGRHYPLQITDKVTTGAPHFVELEHHQPANLTDEQRSMVFRLTEKALDLLGITDGASHSEYKITTDGRVFVIEIGARMGGDFIGSDLVELSTGYDFLKGVIDVALGVFEEPALTKKSCAGVYFLCKETSRVMPFILNKEGNTHIVRAEITDSVLHELSCSADRSGYLIYTGEQKYKI